MPRTRTPLAPTVVALVGAVVLCGAFLLLQRDFFHDDAYISLRYVRNWLAGDGLVWNPGERVEGYTNFLHIALVAAVGKLGVALPLAARTVNALALAGLVAGFAGAALRASRRGESALPWALATAFVASANPLVLWTLGGLEGVLLALFVAAGNAALFAALDDEGQRARDAGVGGALLALGVLTRPDAVVVLAVGGLALLARVRSGWKPALAFAAGSLAILVPHTLWRYGYYGELLPNTFYAKATGLPDGARGGGWAYLGRWLGSLPYLGIAALIALPLALRDVRRRASTWMLAGQLALFALYLVRIGGDHMVAHRLLAPMVPVTAVLVARGLRVALPPSGVAAWIATAATLGLCAAQPLGWGKVRRPEDPAAYVGRIVGEHIRDAWPEGSVVALSTAGSTPFHAPDHVYIDMLGLNDAVIARRQLDELRLPHQRLPGHAKGDGAYVLERDPTHVILGPAHGRQAGDPLFLGDLELAESDAFRARYEERRIEIPLDDRPGIERYRNTRDGVLLFTYYERRSDESARE